MPTPKEISRRDFLKTAGLVGTGSLLVSGANLALAASGPEGQKADGSGKVPTRPFGKTGVNVSILSLGTMFDIPSNHLLLRQALNWGVTYWDTADCYEGGKSETGIGQYFKKDPEARKRVFLVTKSDARDPDGMSKLLARSLERMNTDWIDLYFIHGMKWTQEFHKETKAWAERAKGEGKIKFFGFSTHSNMEECMLAAAKMGWIDGIMMSYNFRIMHSEKMKEAVKACVDAGIGLTAMKTQGGGSVKMESEAELKLAGRFLQSGFTDKQAKLKAVWEDPDIASICSQMPNMTILASNVAAALDRTSLSAEESELLRRYALETCTSYCAGCAEICESAVEGAPPIRDVMRCLMYYNSYGERDMAREHFARLSDEMRSRFRSLDYRAAERKCPQGIAIGRLMKEAASLLG